MNSDALKLHGCALAPGVSAIEYGNVKSAFTLQTSKSVIQIRLFGREIASVRSHDRRIQWPPQSYTVEIVARVFSNTIQIILYSRSLILLRQPVGVRSIVGENDRYGRDGRDETLKMVGRFQISKKIKLCSPLVLSTVETRKCENIFLL